MPANMSENAALLSSDCVLNAFYVCFHFLLTRPLRELHLAAPLVHDHPIDIRLHDFSLRYQLGLTCLAQVIRTVHASRHAAYHYDVWSLKRKLNSIEEFTYDTFGVDANIGEVRDMVKDGQRLGRIEYECQDVYASFIVALDWRRFQATPDALLLQLTTGLLSLPAVQGLRGLLPPRWPSDSFGYYHEQVVQYRRMNLHQRRCFMIRGLSTTCGGCTLLVQPPNFDSSFCVGCRRGGFVCRSARNYSHVQLQSSPKFLICALDLLHRGNSKCDSLMADFGLDDHTLTPQSREHELLCEEWTLPMLAGPVLSQEVQILHLVLGMDQKLERLCDRSQLKACECCRQRKVKCLRGPKRHKGLHERHRQTHSYGSSLRTLLPVKEEEHDG